MRKGKKKSPPPKPQRKPAAASDERKAKDRENNKAVSDDLTDGSTSTSIASFLGGSRESKKSIAEASGERHLQGRPVVLLNLSCIITIDNEKKPQYNEDLLQSLSAHGLRDVVLIVPEWVNASLLRKNPDYIAHIKETFTVHAVATMADLLFHRNDEVKAFAEKNQAQSLQDPIELIKDGEFAALQNFADAKPGTAFAAAAKNEIDDTEVANIHGMTALTGEYMESVSGSAMPPIYFLYEMILKNKFSWVNGVVFIDNEEKNTTVVSKMHPGLSDKEPLPLLTIVNPQDKGGNPSLRACYDQFLLDGVPTLKVSLNKDNVRAFIIGVVLGCKAKRELDSNEYKQYWFIPCQVSRKDKIQAIDTLVEGLNYQCVNLEDHLTALENGGLKTALEVVIKAGLGDLVCNKKVITPTELARNLIMSGSPSFAAK